MKNLRRVKIQRVLKMYASLWHSSGCLLRAGKAKRKGCYHQFLASIVFTAFTLEAYLNHIGVRLFSSWNEIDRLSPEAKLALVCERLGVPIEKGSRPWQTVGELIRIRNKLAHGKTLSLANEYTETYDQTNESEQPNEIIADWEAYATEQNADRARQDVKSVITKIQTASGIEDKLFFSPGITASTINQE